MTLRVRPDERLRLASMARRQRGESFEARMERAVSAVWAVLRARAGAEALGEVRDALRVEGQRRGPRKTRRGNRPDLDEGPAPGARSHFHSVPIPDPEFAQVVREYLHNQIANEKRRYQARLRSRLRASKRVG